MHRATTVLAIALTLFPWIPAGAGPGEAVLAGRVTAAGEGTPLAGARVHLVAETGSRASDPVPADGSFRVDGLPPGTYRVGVEFEGRLHVVPTPLPLAEGENRSVEVAVQASTGVPLAPAATGGVWNNPLYASLIIVGGAIILGLLLDKALEDDGDGEVSPSGV